MWRGTCGGSVWRAACCAGGACGAPEHGGCGAGHGARRPLRAVVHVARDTSIWANIRRHHLQYVELRRHLENAAGKRWVRVQLGGVAREVGIVGERTEAGADGGVQEPLAAGVGVGQRRGGEQLRVKTRERFLRVAESNAREQPAGGGGGGEGAGGRSTALSRTAFRLISPSSSSPRRWSL
jgi:hypothetical protein